MSSKAVEVTESIHSLRVFNLSVASSREVVATVRYKSWCLIRSRPCWVENSTFLCTGTGHLTRWRFCLTVKLMDPSSVHQTPTVQMTTWLEVMNSLHWEKCVYLYVCIQTLTVFGFVRHPSRSMSPDPCGRPYCLVDQCGRPYSLVESRGMIYIVYCQVIVHSKCQNWQLISHY